MDNKGFNLDNKSFSTRAIHGGYNSNCWPGKPVVVGISLSSTFKQIEPAVHNGYEYSRSANPTRDVLEANLAKLEKGKYGLVFGSGLGATTTICLTLSAGDEIVCMDDVYGGTNRLFNKCLSNFNINIKMVDCTDLNKIKNAITPGKTKIVWVETPTNPLLKIVDIKAVGEVIKAVDKNIIYVVDNTFMSPYFQNPLCLGADVVMHSLTKYINGHSDVVMGCLVMNDESLYQRIKFVQNAAGAVPSPFDSYLVIRGIKTLAIRMEQHQKNALGIAKFLEKHPKVQKVIYPGLPSHPQHELIKKQASGFSGMLSIILKGDLITAKNFINNLEIFTLAESLGGYESLIELPALMTHSSVPEEQRKQLGLYDSMVRMSVGLEDMNDLIDDISNALAKC